ncbi:MAG: hypothetical protein JXA43_03070 [Candidatus Diapherotrites archaeon]|nr:hypothetical protein [Candidatus Diapherotrites archaeon]
MVVEMCLKYLIKPFEQFAKAPLILVLFIAINLIMSFAFSDYLLNVSYDLADSMFTILGAGQPLAAVPSALYATQPDAFNFLILLGFVGFFFSVFLFALAAAGVKSAKETTPLSHELGLLFKRVPGMISLSFLLFLFSMVVGLLFLVLFQAFTLLPNMGIISTVISTLFVLLFAVLAFMFVIKLFVAIPAFVMNADLKPQKAIRASLEFSRGKYLHIFLLVLASGIIVTVVFNLLSFVLINLDEPLLSVSLALVNGVLAWYMFLVPSYYYSENKK